MAETPFRIGDFDSGRLKPSPIPQAAERGILHDPQYPDFIVKAHPYSPEWANGRAYTVAEQIATCIPTTYREIERYRRACPELQVAGSFVIVEPAAYGPPNDMHPSRSRPENVMIYQYVERLTDGRPNANNPAHWPFLRALGAGQLKYLRETLAGDTFCSELLGPHQVTIGRRLRHPDEPEQLWLHDIMSMPSMSLLDIRRGYSDETAYYIDEEGYRTDTTSFADAIEDLDWIHTLPARAGAESLKQEIRQYTAEVNAQRRHSLLAE